MPPAAVADLSRQIVARAPLRRCGRVVSRTARRPADMPKRRASKSAAPGPPAAQQSAADDGDPAPAAKQKHAGKQKELKSKKSATRDKKKQNEAPAQEVTSDEVEWEAGDVGIEEHESDRDNHEQTWTAAADDADLDRADVAEQREPEWDATQKEESIDFDIDFAKGRRATAKTRRKRKKPEKAEKGEKEYSESDAADDVVEEDSASGGSVEEDSASGRKQTSGKKKAKTVKKGSAVARLTKAARGQLLALHQVHLLFGLAHIRQLQRAAAASRVAARLLSLLPQALLPAAHGPSPVADVPALRIALQCLRTAVPPSSGPTPALLPWTPAFWRTKLEQALIAGRAGPQELPLLFVALCWIVGWTARLVAVLTPPSKNRRPGPLPVDAPPPRLWVEVRSEALGRWVPIDVWENRVDEARAFEPELPKGKAAAQQCLTYVVGVDQRGLFTDVTARYSRRYTDVALPQRVTEDPGWWPATLLAASDGSIGADALDADLATLDQTFPTSQDQYRQHPLYCLEKFVGKFEILYPKDRILGYMNGQPIYPRDQLHKLHTLDGWLKEGREVQPGAQPIKRVPKRQRPPTRRELEKQRALGNEPASRGDVELYGEWQTRPYQPATAHDGIVPKSPFGNVYLYKAHMLPRGTVHVQLPGVARVCRFLGVDFAPALVGWELRNGQNVPVLDGVVVCQEYYGVVREAWEEHERRQADRQAREIRGSAARLWRRLARALLVRARLAAAYAAAPARGSRLSVATGPHTHTFDPADDVYSDRQCTWLHRCSCGHTVPFEKI